MLPIGGSDHGAADLLAERGEEGQKGQGKGREGEGRGQEGALCLRDGGRGGAPPELDWGDGEVTHARAVS